MRLSISFHKPLSDLTLFYISLIFSYSYFWIALAVPYLMWRGLTAVETFSLMSIYQLIGVAIEYPLVFSGIGTATVAP